MQDVAKILTSVKEGKIDPQEALEAFETPVTWLDDIAIPAKVEVIPSGFHKVDDFKLMKRGQGELVVLGARPSMGKSALMFQVAANIARDSNVLIFSLEMDKESIVRRLIAAFARVDLSAMERFSVDRLHNTRKAIEGLHLAICDQGGLDTKRMRNIASTVHRHHPLALVVVDYLGMLRTPGTQNKAIEVGEAARDLKDMAKDLKCPVFMGCQLNRSVEARGRDPRSETYGEFKPDLSDLRDSGNIEEHADVVMFLSRPDYYKKNDRPGEADVTVAKNRNGEIGEFTLRFSKPQVRFYDDLAI